MLQCVVDDLDATAARMVEFARAKLLCQNNIDVGHQSLGKPNGRTAIVDIRLTLDYEPRRESTRSMEADLVASHMRIAYSVPKSREYLYSGYPSEPLLAEAAAQQMHTFRSHNQDAILEILVENMQSGLLDKGERGELVARELLVSAYDRAVEQAYTKPGSRTSASPVPFYSAGVSLITFINELFTAVYANNILDGRPNNVSSQEKFRDAFKDAKVRFTHFARMADNSATTTEAVWPMLIRSAAILTRPGETGVDIILPVLLSDEAICEEVVTGVLVQIKRRRVKGTMAAYEIDQRSIGFFPKKTSLHKRPYISLVMELGVQRKPNPVATTHVKTKVNATTQPRVTKNVKPAIHTTTKPTPSKLSLGQPGRLAHPTDHHPRYSIFAYGCSDTVYKGIAPAQRGTYQLLLGSRDFLSDHPRQDESSLSSVRMMKPFWSVGLPCWHWLQESPLKQMSFDDDGAIDDTLLTGVNVLASISDDEDTMPPVPSTSANKTRSATRNVKRVSNEGIPSGRNKRGTKH
jgi:hypothetical protein